jgi:hypothetical protein
MNTAQPPDDAALHIERIGPIATPRRVAVACLPILGMTLIPLLPFAITPTLWFGIPAVMVWMAAMVVLTVVILQLIDRGITRQAAAAHADVAARDGGEA